MQKTIKISKTQYKELRDDPNVKVFHDGCSYYVGRVYKELNLDTDIIEYFAIIDNEEYGNVY